LGQIAHRKGIKILLDAARLLSGQPIEFILVGPLVSPELLRDMPTSVHWLGATAYENAAMELRRADVFVLPSLEDAYGLVTAEAMATGLPVVVTDHAGSSELITDGLDGLIVPAGQVTPLVEAIQRLVDDPRLRLRIARAARDRVQADSSWDNYGQSVLDLIGGYLNSKSTVAS
jgi:glycosyltransferase involved in cell wall biosynthesis